MSFLHKINIKTFSQWWRSAQSSRLVQVEKQQMKHTHGQVALGQTTSYTIGFYSNASCFMHVLDVLNGNDYL